MILVLAFILDSKKELQSKKAEVLCLLLLWYQIAEVPRFSPLKYYYSDTRNINNTTRLYLYY